LSQVLGSKTFKLQFEAGKMGSLEGALKHLCTDVEAAVKAGAQVRGGTYRDQTSLAGANKFGYSNIHRLDL